MAEQQVLVVDPQLGFKNTCVEVLSGLEPASADITMLSEQLQAIRSGDMPGIGKLWPQVKDRLTAAAQAAYNAELHDPGHVEAVFPTGNNHIESGLVGVTVMTATQFRKQTTLGVDASKTYHSMRAATASQLRAALVSHTEPAKLPIPTKARARQAAAVVIDDLSERIRQATALIEHDRRAQSLTGRVTGFLGKTLHWTHEQATDDEPSIYLHSLMHDLQCLLDNPTGYLAEAMADQLRPEAETLGRNQAIVDLPELIEPHLDGLQTALLSRVKGSTAVAQAVQMAPEAKSPRPRRRKPTRALGKSAITTRQDGPTSETAKSPEGFEFVADVPVVMPWLGDGDVTRTLQRYNDGQGNTILCIAGQSAEALGVEAANRRKHGQTNTVVTQDGQWRRVLSRLAAAGDFGERQFPTTRNTHSTATAVYTGVTIQYDKQVGGSQKIRTFFSHGRVKDYIDVSMLNTLEIDPQEPLAVLLGRCDKFSEDAMIRLFRSFSRTAVLRKAVAL